MRIAPPKSLGLALGVLAALALGLAALQVASSAAAVAAPAPAPSGSTRLSSSQVVAAFQRAGLSVQGLRQEPVGGSMSPSGPPATEREAWGFEIAGLAPRGGRILVFADDPHLQAKAAWFHRVGATILIHRNVIVWLDPAVPPSDAAAYRAALEGLS